MRPLSVEEIRPPSRYEPVRAESRRRLIELKRHRRVALGPLLSAVFENRETVRGVIEEVLRAERIELPGRIAEEVEAFNSLIPGENELSATLFIEVTDPAELAARLGELRGVEGHVHLEVGGARVDARPQPGGEGDDRAASVHQLRFAVGPEQRDALAAGAAEVALVVDHPAYRARQVLDRPGRESLAADLGADHGSGPGLAPGTG